MTLGIRHSTMASSALQARIGLSSAARMSKVSRPSSSSPSFRYRPRLSAPPRRAASTNSSSNSTDSQLVSRLRTFVFGTSIVASLYVGYLYATDTRASFHRWIVPPLLRVVWPDAEDAHHNGTAALQYLYALGLHPRERPQIAADGNNSPSALSVSVYGTELSSPIGISAGLDKDAEIPDVLFALGASVVEVGGCTPRPQTGNPRPRVFRVPGVDGMVNRYGLNSRGADAMAARLRDRLRRFARNLGLTERDVLDGKVEGVPTGSLQPGRLLLVQVAKNKATNEKDVDAVIRDYVYCVNRLAPYADVLVVNVSSPNTPGLRDLQATEPLTKILTAVVGEARRTERREKPKVMVKVSPDEDDATQVEGVVQAVWKSGVDGVIVGNTTKRRDGLVPQGLKLSRKEQQALAEEGGFSGPAMFERTLDLVKRYRKTLDGPEGRVLEDATEGTGRKDPEQKVVFATGGITNGDQALKILNAGASVALIYTGMVYGGAGTITRIKDEMRKGISKQGS